MLRRLVAMLMLLAVTFSSMETVIGELRDGLIHHESALQAATHAQGGEHGHEDGAVHGPEHQHGTSSDHCTHQHGEAFDSTGQLVMTDLADTGFSFPESSLVIDRLGDSFFRPPRA